MTHVTCTLTASSGTIRYAIEYGLPLPFLVSRVIDLESVRLELWLGPGGNGRYSTERARVSEGWERSNDAGFSIRRWSRRQSAAGNNAGQRQAPCPRHLASPTGTV